MPETVRAVTRERHNQNIVISSFNRHRGYLDGVHRKTAGGTPGRRNFYSGQLGRVIVKRHPVFIVAVQAYLEPGVLPPSFEAYFNSSRSQQVAGIVVV